MNKKKILTGSIVMAMSLGIIGPVNKVLTESDFNPFISEAYAAGEVKDLGDGRTLEFVEKPTVTSLDNSYRKVSGMKIRLKGFKDGDKLYLRDFAEIVYPEGGFDIKKGDREVRSWSVYPRGQFLVYDSNHGTLIGEHPLDSHITSVHTPIIFNKNIEKYDSVDLVFKENTYYFYILKKFDENYLNDDPMDYSYIAFFTTKDGKKSKDVEILKGSMDISNINLNFFKPDFIKEGSSAFEDEIDSKYLVSSENYYRFKEPLKKGQSFDFELIVPDGVDLKEPIVEDFFVKTFGFRQKSFHSYDYEKNVLDRGFVSYPEQTYKSFEELGLKYNYEKVRNSENNADVYKWKITNVDGTLDNVVLSKNLGRLYFYLNGSDFEFISDSQAKILYPNKIIKLKATEEYTDKNGETKSLVKETSLDTINLYNGSVDAFGVLKLDLTKPISKKQTTPQYTQPDIKGFLKNPDSIKGFKKIEYKDGKLPDVSKPVEDMVVDMVITYEDGRKDPFKSLLTVTPVDKSKLVTINYELENGDNVKTETVLKTDATKVATPETEIPKGYEVNWVKK